MTRKELKEIPTETLERMCKRAMDELYQMRQELSRRKNDLPPASSVNFEAYITK